MMGLTGPQIAIAVISIGMISGGFILVWNISRLSRSPVNSRILEVLGLSFILPVVLLLAVSTKVNMEAIVGIVGGLIGYVFGTYQSAPPNEDEPQK